MSSSTTTSSPSPLEIPELLSSILSSLPLQDLLHTTPHTSKTFHHSSLHLLNPQKPECYYLDTEQIHRTRLNPAFQKCSPVVGFTPAFNSEGIIPRDTGFPRRLKLEFRVDVDGFGKAGGRRGMQIWNRIRLTRNEDVEVRVWLYSDSGGGMGGLRKKDTVLRAGATVGEMMGWLIREGEKMMKT